MSENVLERPHPPTPSPLRGEGEYGDAARPATISLEFILYAALLALALGLRLFGLDGSPRLEEVPDLLAAWRGTTSASPALFWAQTLSFDLLGGSVLSARLLTAIAGALLALSPALFRIELGRTRALGLTLLLTFSAPMLITARTAAPVVWTALFGVIALRLWLTHLRAPTAGRGTQAVVATTALLLLGDPSGVVLALLLLAGAALVYFWRAATADSDAEFETDRAALGAALRAIPWEKAVLIAALVVAAIASGFMTAPSGLSNIGGVLGGVGRLFTPDGNTLGGGLEGFDTEYAFGVSVYYQLVAWALAIAAILLNRVHGWSAADRFFVGWLLATMLAFAFLPGLRSQHTILIALPLCGLVSGLAAYCFAPDRRQHIFAEQQAAGGDELAMLMSPPAGRLILMWVVFALMFIFTVHLGAVAREVIMIEDGSLVGIIGRMQANFVAVEFRNGLLWAFISAMFLLVGFFLAGSIWGNRVALQGYGLGFLAVLVVSQLSAGWYVTVEDADSPVEPWHHEATGDAYALLERTLAELNFREAQGLPLLPVTVVRNRATGQTENGLLGWALRDYPNVTFVDTLAEAATAPIVIAPDLSFNGDGVQPDLGGSYVGQRFILTRAWRPGSMIGLDPVTWFLQRKVRVAPEPLQTVTLWVRQDVFDSRPIQDLLD